MLCESSSVKAVCLNLVKKSVTVTEIMNFFLGDCFFFIGAPCILIIGRQVSIYSWLLLSQLFDVPGTTADNVAQSEVTESVNQATKVLYTLCKWNVAVKSLRCQHISETKLCHVSQHVVFHHQDQSNGSRDITILDVKFEFYMARKAHRINMHHCAKFRQKLVKL